MAGGSHAEQTHGERRLLMDNKLLLIVLDGLPWRTSRTLMGNLEGWVESGEAQVLAVRSVLPSTSASCYASMHTGVTPQVHRVTGNNTIFRVQQPDVFSGSQNQMTPADTDLFATLSNLCQRFSLDYGLLHTCTLDSMGHRFGHDCAAMDHACFVLD